MTDSQTNQPTDGHDRLKGIGYTPIRLIYAFVLSYSLEDYVLMSTVKDNVSSKTKVCKKKALVVLIIIFSQKIEFPQRYEKEPIISC